MQSGKNTMSFRSIFDAGELKSELEKSGVKPSFMPYIWKQVIQNPDAQLDQIPSLPSAAYPLLTSKFKTLTSCVHSAMDSSDQLTTKLLIKLQVGCKMGCTFCATGSMGFKSNLTSGEIVEQLVHASRISPIRNVVFMGMGEPLNNYGALVEAIHVMTGPPFHLSPKKITVSTVVNLIPFNPIGDLSKFSTSNEEKVSSFQKILRGTYGIRTTVRKEMGQDISGACGQLVVNKSSIENTVLLTDIEDLQVR
ncbi:hypothetical protein PRUPE_8G144200 [Prunus persica]|uniref:Radical SAM core domain-containing protein n=1 Tax=Prunus persica TaxID=3760 RepID=A0A251MXX0_PRUPE|nr:hypothetical protein PRUPE_8G144200 [Prunus persica]